MMAGRTRVICRGGVLRFASQGAEIGGAEGEIASRRGGPLRAGGFQRQDVLL